MKDCLGYVLKIELGEIPAAAQCLGKFQNKYFQGLGCPVLQLNFQNKPDTTFHASYLTLKIFTNSG